MLGRLGRYPSAKLLGEDPVRIAARPQRYVADVKAEVNRSIELEELKKMKSSFEEAAHDVEKTVNSEIQQTTSDLDRSCRKARTRCPSTAASTRA